MSLAAAIYFSPGRSQPCRFPPLTMAGLPQVSQPPFAEPVGSHLRALISDLDKQDDNNNPPHAALPESPPAVPYDEPICVFCLESGDEPLHSPCGCRGSAAYVHASCATSAYIHRAKLWDFSCPTCRQPYEGPLSIIVAEAGMRAAEKELGWSDPRAARVLLGAASAYGRTGDAAKQKEFLQRALEVQEASLGSEHGEVALVLVSLAVAHGRLGEPAEQRTLLERALAIQTRVHGSEHPALAVTLSNLGNAHGALGDAVRQRELLEHALRIKQRTYGEQHREAAITMTNLAAAYGRLGETDRQKELLEKALLIKEREYGASHREVAITLTNLGSAYGDLGDADMQQRLLSRARDIDKRVFGETHPSYAVTLVNLGVAQGRRGHHELQREYSEVAVTIFEQHFGEAHPHTSMARLFAAEAYAALGAYDVAKRVAQTSEGQLRAAYPFPSAIFAEAYLVLALLNQAQNDEEKARASWTRAIAELREAVGASTAAAKLKTLQRRSALFWANAKRPDVVAWLEEKLIGELSETA